MGGTTDAKHQGKELMKFPLERERDEKSDEEKLNWAASGSGNARLRKCNKAV